MIENQFTKQMDYIVQCIKQTANDPYEQLTGYIETNNEVYITRTGNARAMIKKLDKAQIRLYLQQMKKK